MSRRRWIIGAVIGLLVICMLGVLLAPPAEDGEETPAPTEIAASAPTEVPTEAPTEAPTAVPTEAPTARPSRCVVASPEQMEAIRSGIRSVQESNDVETGWAVKSNDFENVWMVAAKITGPGMEGTNVSGVWAIGGDPNSPGIIMAVDAFAKEFTPYPDASETDANITIAADGVIQARECAAGE